MKNTEMLENAIRTTVKRSWLAMAALLLTVSGCTTNTATVPALVQIVPPANNTVEAGSSTFVLASAVPIGVNWSLSGNGCTGTACGTLVNATQTSVNYVAPGSLSGQSLNVTLTATSSAAASISAATTFTVLPVAVVIAPLTSDVLAPGQSLKLSASVTNDLSGAGVIWSVQCASTACGTFTNTTSTAATYTAPTGISGLAITITATSAADPQISASVALSIPVLSTAIHFLPLNLPAAVVNQPYSATIKVSGGTAPYSFTESGIPAWLSVNATTNSVTFTGTPTSAYAGSSVLQLTAIDSSTPVALTNIDNLTITTYATAPAANALLNGSYAFYGTGWLDASSTASTNRIAYIGSFTADGNGNITAGELDVNSPTGAASYSSVTGTYDLASNQTGVVTLLPGGTQSAPPITLAVSVGGVSNGIASAGTLIEYDDSTGIGVSPTGTSSGVRLTGPLSLQTAAVLSTTATPLSGSFAFGLGGGAPVAAVNATCATIGCPISVAGALTFGTNGAITTGVEDLTIASTATSNVSLTGQIANSGNTDSSGRVTGTIAASISTLPTWPADYIVYMVSPQMFYVMSADSFASSSLLAGEALQQNLADIATTPFSSIEPVVMYGDLYSSQNLPTSKGEVRGELQLLTLKPTSATAGSFTGTEILNASGTWSTPSAITSSPYTVQSNGRVTVTGTSDSAYMYLVDTSTGFATANGGGGPTAGTLYFEPQSSTSLNAGNYFFSVSGPASDTAPIETGILTLPTGGVGSTASGIAVTGQAYASFSTISNDEGNSAGTLLFTEPLTGTFSNATGTLTPVLSTGIQGCASGEGFVISTTKFACLTGVKSGTSYSGYAQVHVFRQ